jgi:hypothetical protein
MQSNTKKRISAEDWQRRLKEVQIRKEDMNRVVMNFLVTEVGAPCSWPGAVRHTRAFPAAQQAGAADCRHSLLSLFCMFPCTRTHQPACLSAGLCRRRARV